ncbi:MAG: M1 family metallopeptidase, partial [Gammaproteobacteria bacterium]|nr:M1 family metallopeptidase [Gammaproteobacteria bacterium]
YDALYYKLELEIDFNPNLLTGKVTGRFKNLAPILDTLVLDLDNALIISSISGPVNSHTHKDQKVIIELSKTFLPDEIIEVTIEYSGIPNGNNRWFVFDQLNDGSAHVWTLSEPYGAKYWWPCKDSPADKADSVDIIVTVPEDQLVASNGLLQSEIPTGNGKKTFHWHEEYTIATYLVSLAIAPYAHFSDSYTFPDNSEMLLDYYVYPENESLARS